MLDASTLRQVKILNTGILNAVLPTTVPVNLLETLKAISALRHGRIPLNSLVN